MTKSIKLHLNPFCHYEFPPFCHCEGAQRPKQSPSLKPAELILRQFSISSPQFPVKNNDHNSITLW